MSSDKDILKERGKVYGPVQPMWEAIGAKQWANFMWLYGKCADDGSEPSLNDLAHLAALNMVEVKLARSLQTPGHKDNYTDGRNYFTIAEECYDE